MTHKHISVHISPQAQSFLEEAPAEKAPATNIDDPKELAAGRKAAHEMYYGLANADQQPYSLKDETIKDVSCLIIDGDHVENREHVIFHIHGGGYVFLEPRSSLAYTGQIGLLSKKRIVSPDYALAPEHPFPQGLDDLRDAYLGLLEQGIDAQNISVFGESAGGGLTLALALYLKENGDPLPACLGLVSPWADLAGQGESYKALLDHDPFQNWIGDYEIQGKAYAGSTSITAPLVSPVHADLSGMPPMLIQVGLRDILASDSLVLNRHARDAGVDVTLDVWEGMTHVWHVFNHLPEAQQANQELADFLTSHYSQ